MDEISTARTDNNATLCNYLCVFSFHGRDQPGRPILSLLGERRALPLPDLDFIDYIDKDDFLSMVEKEISFGDVQALFHLGACSSTTEWDGKYLMQNNFEYSKKLLNYCQKKRIQFLYASSASVYGLGKNGFREERSC